MELVLNLKPEEEMQIRSEAASSGMEVSDYAIQRILGKKTRLGSRVKRASVSSGSEELTQGKQEEISPNKTQPNQMEPKPMTATMALLKSWLEEDATDDPEELRIAEEELLEFKRNMNLPRKEVGGRLPYPEAE